MNSTLSNQTPAKEKAADAQIREYGRTRQAIEEAIRICTEQDILREYLERREQEVVDIYATLFDQDQVMEDYIASLRREIREEADERISKETVRAMYQDKVPIHKIAGYLRKDTKTIEAWLGLRPQE